MIVTLDGSEAKIVPLDGYSSQNTKNNFNVGGCV
jgi:hypothetical protein